MKLAGALVAVAAANAGADPLRLRADAFATSAAPAGLLVLDASGAEGPNLSAEAVVWTGSAATPGDRAAGDVLVIALRARTPDGTASGTVGRFVAMLGALRPVHVDGASGRVRLPRRVDLEAYAGIPVVPTLTATRSWDWVAGTRASRRVGDWGSVGLAFLEQREDGRLATEEVGVDAGAAIGKRDDIAGKVAYDLATPGLASVALSASHREGALRGELFASYLSASHLLPATSLFSVLGDTPAERLGTTLTWRAAPRLDVSGDVGVRRASDETAPELVARAKLRLDDLGTSSLTGELRRDGVGDSKWTGARGTARIGLGYGLAFTTELELVVPDHDRGFGTAWPWALAALAWEHGPWQAAAAVEASSSPESVKRIDVLGQLARRWGTK